MFADYLDGVDADFFHVILLSDRKLENAAGSPPVRICVLLGRSSHHQDNHVGPAFQGKEKLILPMPGISPRNCLLRKIYLDLNIWIK